ncbi:MAG: helical backbone metal receptor [Chloroflexota bacterium]
MTQIKIVPELKEPPQRVVSLVPSITESLFVLGFGESVVGITDYCTHPADRLVQLPRVGGTKNPEVDKIIGLQPDLVFINQEENSPDIVNALQEGGIKVWVTFPQSVNDAVEVLRNLLAIYQTDSPAMHINSLQMAVDWAAKASEQAKRVRYFCPIWQEEDQGEVWWMTFNNNTYAHDLLGLMGGENVFAERERKYPLAADLGSENDGQPNSEKDNRYPRVSIGEVIDSSPELILLPDEPYKFNPAHKDEILNLLAFTPAVKNNQVHLVDGSLITWHGVRLGKALQKLTQFFHQYE